MAHLRTQAKKLVAGPASLVGVEPDDLDGDLVVVVGEGVGEPGEQFEVVLAGHRFGHGAEGQGPEFCCGQGSVDRDSVGGQGREGLDDSMPHRRVDAPGTQPLPAAILTPRLLVHERQHDAPQVDAVTPQRVVVRGHVRSSPAWSGARRPGMAGHPPASRTQHT